MLLPRPWPHMTPQRPPNSRVTLCVLVSHTPTPTSPAIGPLLQFHFSIHLSVQTWRWVPARASHIIKDPYRMIYGLFQISSHLPRFCCQHRLTHPCSHTHSLALNQTSLKFQQNLDELPWHPIVPYHCPVHLRDCDCLCIDGLAHSPVGRGFYASLRTY